MRIVIDMQGAQTSSRFRGIGRYTLSFVQAVVRNREEHEIILALSGLFPDTIEPIRAAFDGLLPQENIRVWHAPGPVNERDPGNDNRREVAELIREAFLSSLQPNVIHITSLFEGFVDDAVTSIGRFDKSTPVTAVLYDLIPLLNPKQYLTPDPRYAANYQRKLQYLQQANRLLAISEFARQEGLANLNVKPNQIINISTAIEPCFQQISIDAESETTLLQQWGLSRHFVLYTGGSDERKNLPRLIKAYSLLPIAVRQKLQLVLTGQMIESDITTFKQTALFSGLNDGELVFTGYVSDEQLVQLYNLCCLYVFPSWHEGFGMPALEAMACGAAVLGANTSSLPEVIGLQEALFDPMDVDAIQAKILQALTDEAFNKRLRDHGSEQAQKFSWDETAIRALREWKSISVVSNNNPNIALPPINQLIKALAPHLNEAEELYLVGLSNDIAQNTSSGIARQLLVDVSELCQRDAATGVQRVVRSYLFQLLQNPPSGFIVLPVYATQTESYLYATAFTARLINKPLQKVKDEPIRWQRGDLFFGLDMQHHVQIPQEDFYAQLRQDGVVVKFLVHDLLPIQLADFFDNTQVKELHEQWLRMIALQDQAICVSQATEEAYNIWLINQNIPKSKFFTTKWVHSGADLEGSKPSLGLPADATETLRILNSRQTFLAVSTLEPRKAQTQILDALEQLWADGHDVNLVLVGKAGWKIESLITRLDTHAENGKRLFWLRGISDEYLELVYKASTCLIAASINEGFGLPIIEAASHGIPVIARDIPVFKEVAGSSAYYFSGETGDHLASALKDWISLFNADSTPSSKEIKWSTWQQATDNLNYILFNKNYERRQLFLDISRLIECDNKTGIHRTVRALVKEITENPPKGYRIELVFATVDHGYHYANTFPLQSKDKLSRKKINSPIEFAPGDIFFGLDLDHHAPRVHQSFLNNLRKNGVTVIFMVYDILPIQFPLFWDAKHKVDRIVEEWLTVVVSQDGAICISKTVAEELSQWIRLNNKITKKNFTIKWFHLGADINNSLPTIGMSDNEFKLLDKFKSNPSFLMISTLEPRKGHYQVLEAFEKLWTSDYQINLVIVGKEGWLVEDLLERIKNHCEYNNRIFWLKDVSDEYLEHIYTSCTCLIAASYGEGFGLPLIEAAQYKIPIIARDIPIFREIAGGHAFFFKAEHPEELAETIETWLRLNKDDQHPKSDDLPWLTWKTSAKKLLNLIL